jgi:hypothetical protein
VHVRLPLVVLADEEHRQVPHRREVHGLVEDPLGSRAVAEEDHRDGVRARHRERQADPRGQRELAADDGRGQHHAQLLDRDVQAAALPFAVAGGLPHDLGEEAARIGTAREQVPGAAVVGEDQVVLAERADDADG